MVAVSRVDECAEAGVQDTDKKKEAQLRHGSGFEAAKR
jgi:hypothetical protein